MLDLYHRGLVAGVGGNVSARLPGKREIWITPSGLYRPGLKTRELVKIDLEGNVLEGIFKPSIEWPLHVGIYKRRPDVNAVIHAHNPVTTGLALAGIKPRPITPEVVTMLGDVPVVEFVCPGTKELADRIGREIVGRRILIMQNHGVVAVGRDLTETIATVEILEEVSVTTLAACLVGKLKTLPAGQIELIKKVYEHYHKA